MPGPIRKPLFHPVRAQVFTPEALALFLEIEATPQHKRGAKVYNDMEHRLARLLNLVPEWWGGNSVSDDADKPPWPDHLQAYKDRHKIRAIREQLLAAVAKLQAVE